MPVRRRRGPARPSLGGYRGMVHFLSQTGLSLFLDVSLPRVAKNIIKTYFQPALFLLAQKNNSRVSEYWPWRCRRRRAAASRVAGSCRSRSRKPWSLLAFLGSLSKVLRRSKNRARERARFLLLFFFLSLRARVRRGRVRDDDAVAMEVRTVLVPRASAPLLLRPDSPLLGVCPSSPRPRPPRRLRTYDSRERNENCVTPRGPRAAPRAWCTREKNRIVLRT